MEWYYRGEGNCSLVVSDSARRKVYRLIKKHYTRKFESPLQCGDSDRKARSIHHDLQQVISYIQWVIQPLLSSDYVVLPKLITVEEELVASIVEQVSSQRPARRLKKLADSVDQESRSALLLSDFCFVPNTERLKTDGQTPVTISVEVKPKKSFISTDFDQASESPGVCKFCMHQHLKWQSGQWPETSNYCPLDLFSGNKDRMKHALQSLIETPQNNCKIWRDGEDIHGSEIQEDLEDILHHWFEDPALEKSRTVSTFLDMVIEILLMSVSPDDPQPHSDLTRSPTLQRCQSSSFTYAENGCRTCQWLPQGCVLERVYAAQLLDDLDILGIYPLYLRLKQDLNQDPQLWSEWGFDGNFPQDWLMDSAAFQALEVDSLDWMVQKVKRFLLSKTLQDCSIMVAVLPVTNKEVQQQRCAGPGHQGNNLLLFSGRWYKVSVALVDLDPKPLDKIPTYHRQASAILASFKDNTSHFNFKDKNTTDFKDNDGVDLQDNLTDFKENGVDLKVNAVDFKDNAVDFKDNSTDFKDNAVDFKDNAVDFKDNSTDFKDNVVNLKGNAVDFKDNANGFKDNVIDLKDNALGLKDNSDSFLSVNTEEKKLRWSLDGSDLPGTALTSSPDSKARSQGQTELL